MNTADATTIFRKSWSLYDLITAHNYMFHQELYADVAQLLKEVSQVDKTYRLLDLGCGNARFLAPVLKKYPPAVYEGVDLSETALNEAQTYLGELSAEKTFCHADLLHAVKTTNQTWDVIFSGFAMHHLISKEKAQFLQAVSQCLSPKGCFILVDVICEDNQSRADYLVGYLKFMRDNWIQIPADQLEEACTHVAEYDYPESLSNLREMSQSVGLKNMQVISHYAQHYVLSFSQGKASDCRK